MQNNIKHSRTSFKSKNSEVKIVLTGGHAATTAIAVVEELIRRNKNGANYDISWVGSQTAIEGKKIPTLESITFPKLGVKTYSIKAGRLQRKITFWTIPSLLKIPVGLIQAFNILFDIRPKIVISFGGFAAFPVVLSAWLLRIPVLIHEQTIAVGLANRMSALFANKIALARKESLDFFPKDRCVTTGNPLLTKVANIQPKDKPSDPPVLFVSCGSRGSQVINRSLGPILPQLLRKFKVIHLTGLLDYKKYLDIKGDLENSISKNYVVYDLVDPLQIDTIYYQADIIVGRAGANTVSEIIATKRPAILIPIPWAYLNEQTKNATYAREFGVATVLPQNELTPERLLVAIEEVKNNWERIVLKIEKKISPDTTASSRVVDLAETLL
ncbi:UDP-N-acetylglucosamine--N-acetylmuramyl-(pentapeptide) pyrophosphoryl-undecaprenol N-acetylglucosamine transferase [Candidatus Woesebacteria bacterium]|nr:UDP-N-acetylglucosamine--N-acetylmuramyl-(pentapeptide) pyrophosphoryl-undecaprenol N-acetylglucosamine transferase [Candidatus Woesebacteria bacterium]